VGPGVGKNHPINAILRIHGAKRSYASLLLRLPPGRAAKRMAKTTGAERPKPSRLLEFDPAASVQAQGELPAGCDLWWWIETSIGEWPFERLNLLDAPCSRRRPCCWWVCGFQLPGGARPGARRSIKRGALPVAPASTEVFARPRSSASSPPPTPSLPAPSPDLRPPPA